MRGGVNGGDQAQVEVHVKTAVNDYVHEDDHDDVNGSPNFPTRCNET